ncbi:MAG: ABC transporter permease [Acidobacteria bacterium]|nr:ABC transporter permease [Acidobacteriota bacterium]
MPNDSRSVRLYRRLIELYSAAFHQTDAGSLEQAFRDELDKASGTWGVARLWFFVLADLFVSILVQVMREVLQDGRYTFRLWARHPLHTVFTIAALAIGIGATTGGFSVVNTLLLSSLPFHDPERLASFHPNEFIPPHDSSKQFHDWREQSTYLANAALVEEGDVNIGVGHEAVRVHAASASWNLFTVLGAPAALGRTFLPGEDALNSDQVAVISYGLWQQLFGGNPGAVGSSIRVNGKHLTIIGVTPPGFDYPRDTGLWMPAGFSAGNNGWTTVARLKPGITWPQARVAFEADVHRLSSAPDSLDPSSPRPKMRPLREALTGPVARASLMLMAGMALILLIACTNVANLLMARIADRTSELSIRSALGASRGRLKRQLLTECLLLCAVSALAGLLVAAGVTSVAAKVQPPPLSAMSYSLFDVRVLAFSLTISVLAGLLFGVLPFFSIGQVHIFGARGSGKSRGSRVISQFLTGAQVALTVILLTASLSIGRAFFQLMAADRGYNARGIVTVNVSLDGTTRQTNEQRLHYFEEVLARIRDLQGVRSASATEFLPLYATGFVGGRFGVDGRRASRGSTMVPTLANYFQTMGGRILEGREFTDAEVAAGSRVAVVNERFAAEFGGSREVLGRQLTIGRGAPWKIIGIVRGMEFETDSSLANSNQVFVPAESPGGFFSTFVARVDGRADDHLIAIREAIRSVDTYVPVFGVKTMEQRLADFFIRPRAYQTAVRMFAGFAVLLALIGIYGIVSHSVAERTQEIGLRMALGATPARVRGMLLTQNLLVIAVGAVLGVVGASAVGSSLSSLIPEARPVGLVTSMALAVSLGAAAAITIWSATRRIPELDIMRMLRAE